MALIIPPGYAQATIPFNHAETAREAVITFGIDVSEVGGDFVAAAEAVWTAWEDTFAEFIDSQVVQGPVRLRVGQDGGDPLTVEGTSSGSPGLGGNQVPSNVALLVRKRTALGGRRGRGRFYIPWGISETSVSDVGVISPSDVTGYQALADTFLIQLANNTPNVPMVLLHDSSGAGVEPGPTVVTALSIDPLVATQRRRLGR